MVLLRRGGASRAHVDSVSRIRLDIKNVLLFDDYARGEFELVLYEIHRRLGE